MIRGVIDQYQAERSAVCPVYDGRMKVAYVTPRYGTEVVGGAEHAARMLAERLAKSG